MEGQNNEDNAGIFINDDQGSDDIEEKHLLLCNRLTLI
jgi:hypothetical protein